MYIGCSIREQIDHDGYFSTVPGLRDIIQVAAGINHYMALGNDGRVYTWGQNYCCQLGLRSESEMSPVQVPGVKNVVQIVAKHHSSFALLASGSVVAWGDNSFGKLGLQDEVIRVPTLVPGYKNVIRIFAGIQYSLFLTEDGNLHYNGDKLKYFVQDFPWVWMAGMELLFKAGRPWNKESIRFSTDIDAEKYLFIPIVLRNIAPLEIIEMTLYDYVFIIGIKDRVQHVIDNCGGHKGWSFKGIDVDEFIAGKITDEELKEMSNWF